MSMGVNTAIANAGRVDRWAVYRIERSRRPSPRFAALSWLCLVVATVTLVMAAPGADAASMNKCLINGTVTYQQAPCPSTQPRKDPTLEELNATEKARRAAAASAAAASRRETAPVPAATPSRFSCDGRTRCTQMHSCAEAKFFIAHCPNAEMDGDGDGIPCEQQWCH
ncbi:MAG: excalibur calcium-binding domain-containing protein [Rubrivivax sp.]